MLSRELRTLESNNNINIQTQLTPNHNSLFLNRSAVTLKVPTEYDETIRDSNRIHHWRNTPQSARRTNKRNDAHIALLRTPCSKYAMRPSIKVERDGLLIIPVAFNLQQRGIY